MRFEMRPWILPTAVGVVSFGLGVVVGGRGYLFSKHKMAELEESLIVINQGYRKLEEREKSLNEEISKFNTRERLARTERTVIDYTNPEEAILEAVTPVETVDVFEGEDPDWNWEEELEGRSEDAPYILHRNEFMAEEKGYRQSTLSWYEGDHVLCDEHDTPIYNPEKILGRLEFGRGSQDPSIVYIRNDKLSAEYEVIRDPGFFQVEVLGEQIEEKMAAADLKHSVLKFRQY